jgi:drug/metabolite transporter (DMT)-like permease
MRADLTLALIALIWGTTFVLIKRALSDVTPILYLALRFSLAAALLALFFHRRIRLGFGHQEFWVGLRVGSVLMLGYVLQTVGLQFTTPSKSAFLTGLYIVLVPFANSLVYRSRPQIREVSGAVVAGLGMALLSMQGETLSMGKGDLLTIGCAVAFAFHIVLLGHWAPIVGYESLSLLQIVSAAAVAVIATPLVESPNIHWSPMVWTAILVGGVFATAVAFVLQTWAQQNTTPARAAILFSLEPVFAWLSSWALEGELLTLRAACGALLILGGILVVELKPAQAPAHP